MAINVFDLYAKLGLDSSGYDNGLKDAGEKGSNFGSKLTSVMKGAAVAAGAVATAIGATSAAFVKATGDAAAYGDNIDKMSQKMGLTAEAYQEWDAVMQHSGTSIESLQVSMKTLASAAETGNKAFQALGISQQELATLSQQELFERTIASLQSLEDQTQRTYLAGQLLGRGATELGALLNTSAEDTQAMRDRVHELGGVMSDEAVKLAAKYQDTLQDMSTAFSSVKRNMISEFMPSVTTVTEGLTELFAGNNDKGISLINTGIEQFSDKFTEILPNVLTTGTKIVQGLGDAITKNAPALIKTGSDAIIMLADGVIDSLVELDDRIPEIIDRVVDIIGEGTSKLLGAGATILHHIADGFRDEYPEFATVVDGVANIVDEGIKPAFEGVLDFLRGDFEGGLIEISHGIEGTVSSSLGVIDGLLDTHLQQWYDETARFFEGFGSYVFNVLNPDAGEAKLSFEDALARWTDVDLGEPFDQAKADFDAMIAKGEEYKKHYTQTVHAIKLLSDDTNNEIQQENEILQDELEEKAEIIEANTKEIEKQQKEAEREAEKRRKAEEKAAADLLKAQQKAEAEMTKNLEKAVNEREKLYSEYQKKVNDIYDKIDDMQESYKLKLADRTNEIYSSFTLFEKVPERLQVSGQDLTQNLEDQLDRMQLFYSELDQLQAKGVSQGLIDEIRSQGVGALDNLDALLDLSDKELENYNKLYQQKAEFASQQADKEFESKLKELDNAVAGEYDKIDKLTAEKSKTIGETFINGIAEGMKNGFGSLTEAATNAIFGGYASQSLINYADTETGRAEIRRNKVSDTADTLLGAGGIVINVNGIQYQNPAELAAAMSVEIQKQIRREGKAYA